MKFPRIILVSAFLLFCSFSFFYAKTLNAEDVGDLQDRIKEYEQKIAELKGKENTLSEEIAYLDSRISYVELKIQEAEIKIAQKEEELSVLSKDVENLENRIYRVSEALEEQEKILEERTRTRYKSERAISLNLFIDSEGLSDIINRLKYLRVAQEQDNKLLLEFKETKQNFTSQKVILEDKKKKVEELKASIEQEKINSQQYQVELSGERQTKDTLLGLTKNDEAEYQRLLENARREIAQILGAGNALQDYEPKEVKKGDVIGLQGNTGYSSGEHLHFGVYRYSSISDISGWDWYYSNYVDPEEMLESRSVYWNTGCSSSGYRDTGDGDWQWPIDSPTISQGFGYTCYSNILYGGNPHPALDMYGSVGTYVYAVEDGEAYFCRNCLGDGGNGVFIFHEDDYMTVYWHLR